MTFKIYFNYQDLVIIVCVNHPDWELSVSMLEGAGVGRIYGIFIWYGSMVRKFYLSGKKDLW